MPLSSDSPGVLISIEHFTIHDQPNVDVSFKLDGSPAIRTARLATESVIGNPQPGDRIEVAMVLGEAFEIRRV